MREMQKHGSVGLAADRSGMDRKTARKYVREGKLPSELRAPRTWRTRKSPISEEDWAWVEAQLAESPALEAKTLFEQLQDERPEAAYSEGVLRTLQRRVKQWRATKGPEREVFFSQQHRPGEAGQTDFTHGKELGVTIVGVTLVHMLCHFVLPYSNWESATVCFSESLLSLRRGVQAALFRLGHHPEWHQTDNSTAATHRVGAGRKFNEEYESMMAHFGMKPRTTEVGAKEQNGDIEAANGALKRRIKQRLIVRGSSDFESVEAYEHWLHTDPIERGNARRRERLAHELALMPVVRADRLPEFKEVSVTVTSWSTIYVDKNTYSVPSRLIAENLRVRIFERTIEVYYAQKEQLVIERLAGRSCHRINYRHIIWSLVQKPGAFARYRYREDLFPSLVFRRAYDAITGAEPTTAKDLAYLRILHLAAATIEADVERALSMLLDAQQVPNVDLVRDLVGSPKTSVIVPEMAPPHVDLDAYDELLTAGGMS